ncbi:hypothetical protein SteCoe_19433 [Stentor coeruleus]|uniref:Uncharacterized protein n=1 Tax=Stentor coeruleus TaxID=5963 RepID=A0A1R2BUT1_9CILI|nr:hypothetical protein SteCoe_19433 [Stentor coeruleus]
MGVSCSEILSNSSCFKSSGQNKEPLKIQNLPLTNLARRYQAKKAVKNLPKPRVIWVLNKAFFPIGGLWAEKLPINDGTYTGELVNSKRHGIGTFCWSDGKFYEGQWESNIQCGYGRMRFNQEDIFEGQWKNDLMNGYGVLVSRSFKYVGDWVNGKQSGKGIETWPDGSSFDGDFILGMKEGKGTLIFQDGSRYIGEFKANQLCGYGVYYWIDNKKYDGNWMNSKKHGKGLMTWPDGKYYDGNYVNDLQEGNGTYAVNENKKYMGEWKAGKKHGLGVIFHKGKSRKGQWEEGKLIRWFEDSADNLNDV